MGRASERDKAKSTPGKARELELNSHTSEQKEGGDDLVRDFEPEEKARLWEHGLHEDNLFHNRLNFFTVLQTALLGVIGVLHSKQPPASKVFLINLSFLGVGLTVFWFLVQLEHYFYIMFIVKIARKHLPELKHTWSEFSRTRGWRKYPVTYFLALLIPLFFLLMWVLIYNYLRNNA